MWNAWVLWVSILPHASNFIMETENHSIQKQLYDSSIIYVGAALSTQNYFLNYTVTKSSIIDDLGVRDPPLAFLFSMQNITKKIKI